MVVRNATKNTLVAVDLEIVRSFKDRALGLHLKNHPRALMFHTRFGIHTLGLPVPIDALVLDEGDRVVKLKENLYPNQFFFWNPRYRKVIELPLGKIRRSQTEVGDLLQMLKF